MSDQPATAGATRRQDGIALVTVLLALVVLSMIFMITTRIVLSEIKSSNGSKNLTQGFAAAEGGLNVRANSIRAKFVDYSRPLGKGPITNNPCTGTDLGTFDLACQTVQLGDRRVSTYVQDVTKYTSGNPENGIVGSGEAFEGLSFSQYNYTINSVARRPTGEVEAQVQMQMQSRLVPLFQFAAFYNDDLEFHPGEVMTLNGRVHTNSKLYLNAASQLNITGKVTAGSSIYHSGKDGRGCTGTVTVVAIAVPCNGSSPVTDATVKMFNGYLLQNQPQLTVPTMGSLAPKLGNQLWDRADVRIVVNTKAPYSLDTPRFEIRNSAGVVDSISTNKVNALGVFSVSKWWDQRPGPDNSGRIWTLYNVDQAKLFAAIASGGFSDANNQFLTVDDASDGGMVWNFSVDDGDPATNGDQAALKMYGFRIGGAANSAGVLQGNAAATLGPATGTRPKGLTIVSNQGVFTWGNYNTVNKIPASIIADTVHVISGAAPATKTSSDKAKFIAQNTTVNAAYLSGIDETLPGKYNGGLQNFTHLHEQWGGSKTLTYNGSFVSLGKSLHTDGYQSKADYSAPTRDWKFDPDFNDPTKLPPLTPRFVYLRQVDFIRNY